jgi:low affinity Fe/Cu permease
LQKTMPVFIVYLGGIFISIACLLIELQVHRRRLLHRASFINWSLWWGLVMDVADFN